MSPVRQGCKPDWAVLFLAHFQRRAAVTTAVVMIVLNSGHAVLLCHSADLASHTRGLTSRWTNGAASLAGRCDPGETGPSH